MANEQWMIYGASGYTGELIARQAVATGMTPILGGRSRSALSQLAKELGLKFRSFPLDSAEAIERGIESMTLVLHCAGPFSITSRPMLDACLRAGIHYLDITGEIDVFESCHQRGKQAERAGCVVMPGVGFDVVPTDCLARALADALPGASRLDLAFHAPGSPSKGSAKTAVEGFKRGGAVREAGVIRRVPLAWQTAEIPFRDKTRSAATVPWGDVSTAYYSTGIENVRVFLAMHPKRIRMLRMAERARWVLARPLVQRFLKRRVERNVTPPTPRARESGVSQMWGKVTHADGRVIEATLTTPSPYDLTVATALECVRRVLEGTVQPGAQTPSVAFGAGFIAEFSGCELLVNSFARRRD